MLSDLPMTSSVLLAFDNPFAKLGVTSWEPLVANAVAFLLMALILKFFALAPIRKMLDERKKRIEEGEAMCARSEQMLEEMHQRSSEILDKAHTEGTRVINEAKETAASLLEQKKEDASRMVEDILKKSREDAELETRRAQEALRAEFARLVAQTAGQVTGKILTDEDKRKIDRETIDSL